MDTSDSIVKCVGRSSACDSQPVKRTRQFRAAVGLGVERKSSVMGWEKDIFPLLFLLLLHCRPPLQNIMCPRFDSATPSMWLLKFSESNSITILLLLLVRLMSFILCPSPSTALSVGPKVHLQQVGFDLFKGTLAFWRACSSINGFVPGWWRLPFRKVPVPIHFISISNGRRTSWLRWWVGELHILCDLLGGGSVAVLWQSPSIRVSDVCWKQEMSVLCHAHQILYNGGYPTSPIILPGSPLSFSAAETRFCISGIHSFNEGDSGREANA